MDKDKTRADIVTEFERTLKSLSDSDIDKLISLARQIKEKQFDKSDPILAGTLF